MKLPYKKPPAPLTCTSSDTQSTMKPNHKHYMKPNTQLKDALTQLNELRAQPPARPNIDEWLTQQAEEVPDLLKMYAYAATLAKHRYESFLAVGFTEERSFELTKIYITL